MSAHEARCKGGERENRLPLSSCPFSSSMASLFVSQASLPAGSRRHSSGLGASLPTLHTHQCAHSIGDQDPTQQTCPSDVSCRVPQLVLHRDTPLGQLDLEPRKRHTASLRRAPNHRACYS